MGEKLTYQVKWIRGKIDEYKNEEKKLVVYLCEYMIGMRNNPTPHLTLVQPGADESFSVLNFALHASLLLPAWVWHPYAKRIVFCQN